METKYKTKNLVPDWRTIEEEESNFIKEMGNLKVLVNWLLENFPEDIEAKYSIDNIGHNCIRIFIHLAKDEYKTIKLIAWLKDLKNWEREKFWREDEGYFAYKLGRSIKNEDGYPISNTIFFEEMANIDGCKIEKKRKMQIIYTTDCEKKRTVF